MTRKPASESWNSERHKNFLINRSINSNDNEQQHFSTFQQRANSRVSTSDQSEDVESVHLSDAGSLEMRVEENSRYNSTQSNTDDYMSVIAERENASFFWLKSCIVSLLVVVFAVASTLSILYLLKTENQRFKIEFQKDAAKLINTFYDIQASQIISGTTLSASYTLYARENNNVSTQLNTPWLQLNAYATSTLANAHSISFIFLPPSPIQEREQTDAFQSVTAAAAATSMSIETRQSELFHDFSCGSLFNNGQQRQTNETQEESNGTIRVFSHGGQSLIQRTQDDQVCKLYREAMNEVFVSQVPVQSTILISEANPTSILFVPVFDSLDQQLVVGFISIETLWTQAFRNVLHHKESMVMVSLTETCKNTRVSFSIEGSNASYLGNKEEEEEDFTQDSMIQSNDFDFYQHWIQQQSVQEVQSLGLPQFDRIGGCEHSIQVFARKRRGRNKMNRQQIPLLLAFIALFVFSAFLFIIYGCVVRRRQRNLIDNAIKSSAIVDSLFPPEFRERIFNSTVTEEDGRPLEEDPAERANHQDRDVERAGTLPLHRKKSLRGLEPIADLFLHTTVMFADIAGFTAWCSEREPSQVFTLLETLYGEFDVLAKQMGVFKVETIGDCYVAVCGLPEPNKAHAVVMARYAWECTLVMGKVSKELEIQLGPGTSELALRVGLHSGSVTAGVLRGDKSRFQLFGDTINVASRMESTGQRKKIQVSESTAHELFQAGKGHWLTSRDELVEAKGKGKLQTYWLVHRKKYRKTVSTSTRSILCLDDSASSRSNSIEHRSTTGPLPLDHWASLTTDSDEYSVLQSKLERLIDWNTEVLFGLLENVIQLREHDPQTLRALSRRELFAKSSEDNRSNTSLSIASSSEGSNSVASQIFKARPFSKLAIAFERKPRRSLTPAPSGCEIKLVLRNYVERIAMLYRDVPFHNFEHASHVALSASKLMKRILSRDNNNNNNNSTNNMNGAASFDSEELSSATFGLSSDPLIPFIVVFAALVHDVDHMGVPNAQLVREGHDLAVKYNNKSVAEQNSVDVAAKILSEPRFATLRNVLYPTQSEGRRFHRLLSNAVLATDIIDEELRTARRQRWEKAFHSHAAFERGQQVINRKATIVIEHIIQASDVAHTMQHWHVFVKWNEKLYAEMSRAFRNGRADKDPSNGWYESQLSFFDGYVIPLAKNLRECGVFGVSSDEYLEYAMANREEWKRKGKQVTDEMIQKFSETPPVSK